MENGEREVVAAAPVCITSAAVPASARREPVVTKRLIPYNAKGIHCELIN